LSARDVVLARYVDGEWNFGIRLRIATRPEVQARDLGGWRDMPFSAETLQGMATLMMNHIRDKHPVVAAMMEANGDNGEWSREVKKEWDATPVVQMRPTYAKLD
jgi:hypothetical protein